MKNITFAPYYPGSIPSKPWVLKLFLTIKYIDIVNKIVWKVLLNSAALSLYEENLLFSSEFVAFLKTESEI